MVLLHPPVKPKSSRALRLVVALLVAVALAIAAVFVTTLDVGLGSQCGSVEHCNAIVCSNGTDQQCKTAGDCAAGYTKDRQCGSLEHCKAPSSLLHGTVSGGGGSYPHGVAVSFTCDDSYYLTGENTAQCGTDGEYTPLPTCSQCGSVEHCNAIVCTSGTDQQCKTAGDCEAGYTQNRQCGGECCP